MRNMDLLRRCDVGNPYKEECAPSNQADCTEGNSMWCAQCALWDRAYDAGLEAAAEVCDAETEAVQRERAELKMPQRATNYAVGSLCLAAQKIRNMKGDTQ